MNATYEFAGKNGCIFQLKYQKQLRGYNHIADVSWISKFPDEKEFLAMRTQNFSFKNKMEKMKDGQKVQIVPCEIGL